MDKAVILAELEKLGRAIGYPLQENRLFQYVEDLQSIEESIFIKVCQILRTSWERASFPPVGAFVNRARELAKEEISSQPVVRRAKFDQRLYEAAMRQEEYIKMDRAEYMEMCIRKSKGL